MQASQNHGNLGESGRFYHQSLEEFECYLLSPSNEHLCTIESSIASGNCPFYSSPSSLSFSSTESPVCHPDCLSDSNNSVYNNCLSDLSRSCSVDNVDGKENKLREVNTAQQSMLGPDSQIVAAHYTTSANVPNQISTAHYTTSSNVPNQISTEAAWSKQAVEILHRKDLKEMLITCAKAVADNDLSTSKWFMSEVRSLVSVSGEPLQRLGAYLLEGLVARLACSGSSIYKALRCKEPTGNELLSYMHVLYEICPYFKFGYLSANGAIAEAMKNENRIHIIDFQIAQGSQWITLIQALAARPGGPPHIRITGIDDSFSAYARGGGLEIVGQRLSRLAESCGVPFEFHAVAVSGCDLESKHLNIQTGEALAVNFALVLHHMPDESVGTQNHRDRLLRMVKKLSPKVVTLVELESNTNTAPFLPRFIETLNYYLAIFESIDVALPRGNKERINVEQHCLARDIVNVIACEGPERVERHELLGKWRLRFTMAGFTPLPLSSYVNATIRTLLQNYCENYRLQEKDGCLYLGWMNRDLVASCAWI